MPSHLSSQFTLSGSTTAPDKFALGLALALTLGLNAAVFADTHTTPAAGEAPQMLEQSRTASDTQPREQVAELEKLRGALEQARHELAAAEQRLSSVQETAHAAAQQLEAAKVEASSETRAREAAEAALAKMEAELAAQSAELVQVREALETAQSERQANQAESKSLAEQLALAVRSGEELRARLDQATAEIQSQREQIASVQAESEALAAEITEARMRLAPDEGGSASIDAARLAASDATETYIALFQRYRRNPTPEQLMELDEAAKVQANAQLLVARISGASGLYQVRPLDTLAIVAARFYGDGARWPRLHEANRHVLADPDSVETGLTLVVP